MGLQLNGPGEVVKLYLIDFQFFGLSSSAFGGMHDLNFDGAVARAQTRRYNSARWIARH